LAWFDGSLRDTVEERKGKERYKAVGG